MNKYVNFWRSIICDENRYSNKFTFKAVVTPCRKFLELSKSTMFSNNLNILQKIVNRNNMIMVKTDIFIPFEINRKNWIKYDNFFNKKQIVLEKVIKDARLYYLSTNYLKFVELEIDRVKKNFILKKNIINKWHIFKWKYK